MEVSSVKKYYYCNHCGTKNKIGTKKCVKCERKVKMKNRPLTDYLLDQTKDDIQSNLMDSLFDKIKYFIKKYLYGIIMTVTIVGGVASNIIVRTEGEIVTEKPNITFSYREYSDVVSIYDDMVKYLKNADEAGLKSLLFETYYPEEAASLGIHASDHIIVSLTRDGVFKNGYNEINKIIPDDVFQLPKKHCLSYSDKCFDLSNTEYNLYDYYLLSVFYVDDAASNEQTWVEEIKGKKFIGKNEFELFFIEAHGKYYLLDLFTYHYDQAIAEAKGNLSLLDYDKQMCYYVGGEQCKEILEEK